MRTLGLRTRLDDESIQNRGVLMGVRLGSGLTGRGWAGAEPGVAGEAGCRAAAWLADLGLRLDEAKQLTAALQAEMVSAQLAVVGERCRSCVACGRVLASKGHYPATFRSLFGDVPV